MSNSETISLNQPPPKPEPLAINATPKQALTWATESYYYLSVVGKLSSNLRPKISESLANSFVRVDARTLPTNEGYSVENSDLNYSVASLVQNLCESKPVLWVVVDGLGWLNHLELLSY